MPHGALALDLDEVKKNYTMRISSQKPHLLGMKEEFLLSV